MAKRKKTSKPRKDGDGRPIRLKWVDPQTLSDNPLNWRTHPESQIKKLAAAILVFRLRNPCSECSLV